MPGDGQDLTLVSSAKSCSGTSAGLVERKQGTVVGHDLIVIATEIEVDLIESIGADIFKKIGSESDERLQKGEGDGERIQTSAVMLVFTSLKGKNLKPKRKH